MSGGWGRMNLPWIVLKADLFLEKLSDYRERTKLRGEAEKLSNEAEEIIQGLKEYAEKRYKDGYTQGSAVGKYITSWPVASVEPVDKQTDAA